MCLITRQIKPITTKKDIVCYKRVTTSGNLIRSYFYPSFLWTINKLESTELQVDQQSIKEIECYDNPQRTYYDYRNKQKNKKLTAISNGFHAGLTIDILRIDNNTVCEFLIPKGSLVFKDATGLIVSNQMMLIK